MAERAGEADAASICQQLIRFDTSNFGAGKSHGEAEAAAYVADLLTSVGIAPTVLSSAPGRDSVVARIPGTDSNRPGLLVHGHLDVVPAVAADWSVDPFGGEVRDGVLWGRGTVDMKGTCAITLAVVVAMVRAGRRPARDVVLAFVADEEDGGAYGAGYLVDEHPELFAGVTEAVSESGGHTVWTRGERLYPIAVGERGSAWMRLTATGTAGHASKANPDNAVVRLVSGLARLATHDWPVRPPAATQALLARVGEILGMDLSGDPDDAIARLEPPVRSLVEATLRCSATPTMLDAGYKVNVIPGTATAYVDGRTLPDSSAEFTATVDRLLGPGIERVWVGRDDALQVPAEGPLMAAMTAAVLAADPAGHVVPFLMSGGTDAKAFSRLGIAGYGFAPMGVPEGTNNYTLAHGIDEHITLDGLRFGVDVFDHFLANA